MDRAETEADQSFSAPRSCSCCTDAWKNPPSQYPSPTFSVSIGPCDSPSCLSGCSWGERHLPQACPAGCSQISPLLAWTLPPSPALEHWLLEGGARGRLIFGSWCSPQNLAHCRNLGKAGQVEPAPERDLSVLPCSVKLPHEEFRLGTHPRKGEQ